jgi:glucose/arabinose dehydrogenase
VTPAGSGGPRRGRGPASLLSGALLAAALAASLPVMLGCGSARNDTRSSPASDGARAGTLVAIGAGLDGPAGLRATVYAKGPPTVAAFTFDPAGRLWLTAAGLETHGRDGLYMISRAGGRALKVVSGLKDPLGLAWHEGRLYVASIGRVDAFGAFDGKRFAEHRKILSGPLAGGENNALALGPDGRFVMGISASCDHCVPTSKWSGSIASFRPDGSDLRLYASRLRAPVGLAYLPGTGELFASINQRDDLGARTPGDWLTVVREGQDWRFPGCYGQGGSACAGAPAPTAVLDRHAAVGSVAMATGQLGASVGTAALVAEWQSGKVQRIALTRAGAGYRGSVGPFLTGVPNPLALALAPDRSLLVGDWASGKIYRVSPASS